MIISGMHMSVAKFFLLIISTIFLIFSHNGIFEGPKCQLCLSDLWVFVWPCPTWNYFRLYRKMLIFFNIFVGSSDMKNCFLCQWMAQSSSRRWHILSLLCIFLGFWVLRPAFLTFTTFWFIRHIFALFRSNPKITT